MAYRIEYRHEGRDDKVVETFPGGFVGWLLSSLRMNHLKSFTPRAGGDIIDPVRTRA